MSSDIGGSLAGYTADSPVNFVVYDLKQKWPEFEAPDSIVDPSSIAPHRLHPNESCWIVLTYMLMRQAGYPVRIVDQFAPEQVNICSSEKLLHQHTARDAFIVVTDGDRRGMLWGDFHLVQSPAMLRPRDSHLINLWPQPGLLPRDPARGDRIERLAYFGYHGNLNPAFRDPAFKRDLDQLGVEFILREDPQDWHNYQDLDLCLAVRGLSRYWIMTKPMTKLAHAWITGCPALMGPEPAYQYWGERGVDYFEVETPSDVVKTVQMLKKEPHRYRRAIELGAQKAPHHNHAGVLKQWISALEGPIHSSFCRWKTNKTKAPFRHKLAFMLTQKTEPLFRGFFRLRAEGLKPIRRRLGIK